MHIKKKKKSLCAEHDAFQKCQAYNLKPTWHILNILVRMLMSGPEQFNNSSAILS